MTNDNVIYHYHPATGEYVSHGIADACAVEASVWLVPAYATQLALPDCSDSQVVVFRCGSGGVPRHGNDGRWSVVEDYRRKELYTPNGQVYGLGGDYEGRVFNGLGSLPDWLHEQAPPSVHHRRTKRGWRLDKAAQKEAMATQVQAQLLQHLVKANDRVSSLQDLVDIGEASDADSKLLLAWKHYRVSLRQVPQQQGYPLAIDWPAIPA